jgi:shikimate kinase
MNIILIGMPGCGKSTVGVLLAKSLLCDFVDTDLIIQNKYKKSLCEIINEDGLQGFKDKENTVLRELSVENSVVATGGSAVYCPEGMQNLRADGRVIYLKLSPEEIEGRIKNIKTRGIAMKEGTTIRDLYNERAVLYEKYADVTICCEGTTPEDCVNRIVKALNEP